MVSKQHQLDHSRHFKGVWSSCSRMEPDTTRQSMAPSHWSHEIVWSAVCSLQWGLIHGEGQLSILSSPAGCSCTATVWSWKFEWFGVNLLLLVRV